MESDQETHKSHFPIRKVLTAGLAVTVVVVWIVAIVTRNSSPIPRSIRKSVSYTLLYPSVLRNGYKIDRPSVKQDGGRVAFRIVHGDSSINVTEQSIPSAPPDLASLQGFKQVTTVAGHAAIGSENGIPVSVLITNSTLVSIGTHNVPNDVLADVVTGMKSLPN